jgi:hypothetical protein
MLVGFIGQPNTAETRAAIVQKLDTPAAANAEGLPDAAWLAAADAARADGYASPDRVQKLMADFADTPAAADAVGQDAAVAAIQFALDHADDDAMQFLKFWNEGEFDVIRRNWESVPEAVFIGADPLHPKTARPAATSAGDLIAECIEAMERVYPLPVTPHMSVADRAMQKREAFRHGWIERGRAAAVASQSARATANGAAGLEGGEA